ncbi:MAG: DUF6531 domain-containing protein, partial [Thermodesulfobacteriota bacterium]
MRNLYLEKGRVMKGFIRLLLLLMVLGAGLLSPPFSSGAELSEYEVWIGEDVPRDLWPEGWEILSLDPDHNYAKVTTSTGWVRCEPPAAQPGWERTDPFAIHYRIEVENKCDLPPIKIPKRLLYNHNYGLLNGDESVLDYDGDGIADDEDSACDPAPERPEVNLGWADDPSLYCPIKIGGSSVNVATGNHTERVADLSVSGPGISLEFFRFYNSQSTTDGPLGFG